MRPRLVVVGAGAAGMTAVSELRELGFEGEVVVVTAEQVAPYNRTAVNKGLLQGEVTLESVRLAADPSAATTWRLGERAEHVDVEARRVRLASGEELDYDALLVAGGAEPVRLDVPGARELASRIHVLRTADDAFRLGARLRALTTLPGPGRVAVVGAGILGAETADSLAASGLEVTLVDTSAVPLHPRIGTVVGDWVAEQQRSRMRVTLGSGVRHVEPGRDGVRLELTDGEPLEVDVVVAACGVRPATAWLESSPLILADGVLVDDRLHAVGAQQVLAAGDLARVVTPEGGVRVEHWGSALAQGRHAARALWEMLGDGPDPGGFAPVHGYSTRLHGRAITVTGQPGRGVEEVVLAGEAGTPTATVVAVDHDGRAVGAVSLGSPRLLNALRPLVAARAALGTVRAAASTAGAPSSR